MPWTTLTICAVNAKGFLVCNTSYIWVDENYGGVGGGGGSYVPPTLTVTPVVSVVNQQVTVTWTVVDSNGQSQYQTAANVAIKNASNVTVASVNVTTPQTATLTVSEGSGYRAVVNVECYSYPSTLNGTGTSSTFSVGPPPPPPPPPTPPFAPSMGMMGA